MNFESLKGCLIIAFGEDLDVKHSKNECEIQTPFYDFKNDSIGIKIREEDEKYIITECGEISHELKKVDFDMILLNDILAPEGIIIDSEQFILISNKEELIDDVFRFLNVMVKLSGMIEYIYSNRNNNVLN